MTERRDVQLEEALRDLGARIAVPEPPDVAVLTESVRARLAQPRVAGSDTLLKAAAAVVVALLAMAVLVTVSPPVRAAVLHLLRFAGIEFSTESAPQHQLPSSPGPLPDQRLVDLPTAHRLSPFPIAVPAALGEPEQVLLIDGQPPRVVSLIYRGGTVRLDEFDGRFDGFFKKLLAGEGVQEVRVGEAHGVWVPGPHELFYTDRDGRVHMESGRLSAKTLIWQLGDITLRLEGDFTMDRARAIAESVR